MAYQLPDGTRIRAPRRGRSFIIGTYRHPETALNSADFRFRWGVIEVPDPTPEEPTPEQVAERERVARQGRRLQTLQNALIDQFDMLMALFQVGRAKGVWAVTDFPQELRDRVTEWRQIIDDYRLEDIDQEPIDPQ
jgi:hypothetical protein